MSRVTETRVDRWEEMFDRDIENLIAGRLPVNTDLQPLRGFVEALRAMALEELPDEFIEFHASESAEAAAAMRATVDSRNVSRSGGARLRGLRPQLATIAISLTLVLGMTGVSWADGAVPGDWYYGIDRAFEAIGIRNGGEAERLQERQMILPKGSDSEEGSNQTAVTPEVNTGKAPGLERGSNAVANAPGGANQETRSRVEALLQYLNDAATVDGQTVSELAKDGAGRPEHPAAGDTPGRSGDAGKPVEPPGKPDEIEKGKPDGSERGQGSGRP